VKEVVVVGAGIGGLTAAWQLRDLDTLVLEADDRVGGRVKSFVRGRIFFAGNYVGEWTHMESAALTAVEAAAAARARVQSRAAAASASP
jgi:protoporphyrinogen oxidase